MFIIHPIRYLTLKNNPKVAYNRYMNWDKDSIFKELVIDLTKNKNK